MPTTTEHPSFCRICSAACGVQVEVGDDRVVAVHGDRENPISAGYLCVKGRASADLHNGEDRLFSSRRRKASGEVEEIDVETAMDEVHERLREIVDRWGPGSVALYYGTGVNTNTLTHSAMKAWMEGLGSPYIYSSMTLDKSAKWVAMGRLGMYTGGKRNAFDADVLLMVGSNPAVSHASPLLPMANPSKWIRDGRAAGQKLIVVDPRLTETAKLADIHVRVRPGEDPTLFAGLIDIVFARDLVDREFCDRYVGPLDPLRAAVAAFTPEYVAARTGVPVETLVEVAVTFAGAARKSAASGTGPNMACDSNRGDGTQLGPAGRRRTGRIGGVQRPAGLAHRAPTDDQLHAVAISDPDTGSGRALTGSPARLRRPTGRVRTGSWWRYVCESGSWAPASWLPRPR